MWMERRRERVVALNERLVRRPGMTIARNIAVVFLVVIAAETILGRPVGMAVGQAALIGLGVGTGTYLRYRRLAGAASAQ
jgi:hypothetical protein